MALRRLKMTLLILWCVIFLCDPLHALHNVHGQEANQNASRNIKFSSASNSELMALNGKHEYEVLVERKRTSQYGQCWADAILKLEKSCNHLDENVQSWLAVAFTHCFLKTSGLDDELADKSCDLIIRSRQLFSVSLIPQLKRCVKSIDMRIFHTYSLFYVHTQSICFYLHSEQWQRHTENLVDNLVQSAHSVSTNLNSAVNTIHQLEELQNSSLNAQLSLNEELAFAKNSLQSFQEQTKEQRDLIEKIIDQFVLLRQFLVIEFSANSAIVYYIFAMLVIYFVTTHQRVQSARLVLYLMLALNFVLEKKAIEYLLHLDLLFNSPLFSIDDNFAITHNVWTIRKFMLIIMNATYIWWMITYRDISQINYKILSENTIILRNIQNQLLNSSERAQKSLNCFSDDESDSESSDSSYSDYESDFTDESFVLTDNECDLDEEPRQFAKHDLRPKSVKSRKYKALPKEYENESVNDFTQCIRSSLKKSASRDRIESLNYYSSDDHDN